MFDIIIGLSAEFNSTIWKWKQQKFENGLFYKFNIILMIWDILYIFLKYYMYDILIKKNINWHKILYRGSKKKKLYGLSLKIIKQIDSYKRSYIIEITKKVQKQLLNKSFIFCLLELNIWIWSCSYPSKFVECKTFIVVTGSF